MNAKIPIELPFKKLCGLISQTGTNPPEIKVIENDFGDFDTVYVTEGVFDLVPTIAGQFPVDLTVFPQPYQEYGANQNIGLQRGGDDFMQFVSKDGGESLANGIYSNNYFEITVYEKIISVVNPI